MRYHQMKVDEINAVIHELWSQTYKGHDIDDVLIKFVAGHACRDGCDPQPRCGRKRNNAGLTSPRPATSATTIAS